MATLPELVNMRERLISARYSGTRSIRDSSGEEIQYKSDAEMASAIAAVNREIQIRESELGCSRVVYPRTSKGL